MCITCGCGDHDHHHCNFRSDAQVISIETDILAKNNQFAKSNRQLFTGRNIFASICSVPLAPARRPSWSRPLTA